MKIEQLPIQNHGLNILIRYFPDIRAFVFGSCVGTFSQKLNDLDLILISAYFFKVVGIKRKELVIRILGENTLKIDPICLTPREFKRLFKSKSLYALSLKESLSEIIG